MQENLVAAGDVKEDGRYTINLGSPELKQALRDAIKDSRLSVPEFMARMLELNSAQLSKQTLDESQSQSIREINELLGRVGQHIAGLMQSNRLHVEAADARVDELMNQVREAKEMAMFAKEEASEMIAKAKFEIEEAQVKTQQVMDDAEARVKQALAEAALAREMAAKEIDAITSQRDRALEAQAQATRLADASDRVAQAAKAEAEQLRADAEQGQQWRSERDRLREECDDLIDQLKTKEAQYHLDLREGILKAREEDLAIISDLKEQMALQAENYRQSLSSQAEEYRGTIGALTRERDSLSAQLDQAREAFEAIKVSHQVELDMLLKNAVERAEMDKERAVMDSKRECYVELDRLRRDDLAEIAELREKLASLREEKADLSAQLQIIKAKEDTKKGK